MIVIESQRLRLQQLHVDDAGFILELLNEPEWLRFIGDKGVRTLDDARGYLASGPCAMYARYGFGLYAVERRDNDELLGICGPIRRETLDDVDIGFAFLGVARGHGYALEATQAVLEHVRRDLGLQRVVAITLPDNHRSIGVLEKVGFHFERRLPPSGAGEELCLYACALAPWP